jgi:predicted RNA-binding Zn-ribbon protein involved in translation (DUF1610 family)
MLDRQHGKIIFECDVCGDTLESDTRDFNEALLTLKNESWSARKIGSDWVHSCPECGVPGERAPLARNARVNGR